MVRVRREGGRKGKGRRAELRGADIVCWSVDEDHSRAVGVNNA